MSEGIYINSNAARSQSLARKAESGLRRVKYGMALSTALIIITAVGTALAAARVIPATYGEVLVGTSMGGAAVASLSLGQFGVALNQERRSKKLMEKTREQVTPAWDMTDEQKIREEEKKIQEDNQAAFEQAVRDGKISENGFLKN